MVDLTLLDEPSSQPPTAKKSLPQLPVAEDKDELLEILLREQETYISELDRVVAFIVAEGQTFEQAGEQLGLEKSCVEVMKRRPEMLQLVLRIQTALRLPLNEQVKRLAPLALQRKMEIILHSKNENAVNAATSFIIEQADGKAVQKVEVQSFNLNAAVKSEELDRRLEAAQQKLQQMEAERQRLLEAKAS